MKTGKTEEVRKGMSFGRGEPLRSLTDGRMNKALIFKIVDSMYNVQIWTMIGWEYRYYDNRKICRTIEDVRDFCEKNNVPENRREWR